MEMHWYGASITCGVCKTETTLQMVLYSADGEFKFTFWCPKCKELVHWQVFATTLSNIAMRKDIEKAQITIPNRVLKPPVKPPPDKLSDKDRKLLSDFGIDTEEK